MRSTADVKPAAQLARSEVVTLLGLVNAAIAQYELRRLRAAADCEPGARELAAVYGRELRDLRRVLAKLKAAQVEAYELG